jgi:hypothetical protein
MAEIELVSYPAAQANDTRVQVLARLEGTVETRELLVDGTLASVTAADIAAAWDAQVPTDLDPATLANTMKVGDRITVTRTRI